MPWIKNLINPRAASMLEHMANDTSVVTERIPDMSFLSHEPSTSHETQTSPDALDLMELYPWNYATMLDDAMFNFDSAEDINMLSLDDADMLFPSIPGFSPSSSGTDGMEDTSLHLVSALHNLHNELSASDPTYSETFGLHAVRGALSATNLKRFAATFFRLSHVHFPIVHIPSFRSTSSRSLLLSLVIQGAFRSPPLDDVLTTRGLLRLAEEYVFRELHDAVARGTTLHLPTTPTLEALQAALVVVYLLAINNSVSSRRQSRVRRIPEIAWAVRHLDLMNVRHMPDEDWQLFIYRETCIRYVIRHDVAHSFSALTRRFSSVATWTAVADWHQCGMFRCMPIMATVELNCNHPCSTAVWDAADAAEFALVKAGEKRQCSAHQSPASSTSSDGSFSFPAAAQSNLREFIDVLMSDKWNRAEQCPRDSYNIHDLTTAIVGKLNLSLPCFRPPHPAPAAPYYRLECSSVPSLTSPGFSFRRSLANPRPTALSNVTITADIMSMMPFTAPALLRALARWQELWNDLTRELDTAALMKTGMSRHSNEMCHLTRKVVAASINKSKHPFFQKVGHKTVTELYSFLIHG